MKQHSRPSIPPAVALSWGVAMTAGLLAVSTQSWALTLLIFAVGILYLCFPPSGDFPKSLLLLSLVLLLLAGTTFLPIAWFDGAFRQPFLDHGIKLPQTLSPQPWLSLENFFFLVASLLWAWSCFETKLTLAQREFLLAGFLCGLGLVAINTILRTSLLDWKLPGLSWVGGQFENRNQTGDLLVMGGIFSFAQILSSLSRRKWRALFWIVLTGLFMVAMIRNGSRAAVGLFVLGLFLLVLALRWTRNKKWDAWLLLPVIIAIAGMIVILVANPSFLDRFCILVAGHGEGRLPIYQDVVSMVLRNPWCGVGLGNFEGVFNIQRDHSLHLMARCLHPDSDWLWLASELGVIGVIIVAFLVALTFRIYFWKTPFPRLSSASLTVAVLFLIHTLFDVGGHRIGTAWSCLYLVGLGASRQISTNTIHLSPLVLRLAGVLLLGVTALRIQAMSVHPLMPTSASVDQVENFSGAPWAEQNKLLEEALAWAPLDWKLYYLRAVARMQSPQSAESSDDDFSRALFLEQSSIDLPLSVGEACRTADPVETLAAWKELLARAGYRREEFYQNLYAYPGLDAKTRLEMAALAGDDPNLQVIAVINQYPAEFNWMLDNFLTANPSLNGVEPALAIKLFDRWGEVGDQATLLQEWPLHSEWRNAGWRGYARALGKGGRYKEAVALALQQMPAPSMPNFGQPQNSAKALRNYQMNPQDAYAGIELYLAQVSAGTNEAALNTLKEIVRLSKHPVYIQYLLAQRLAASDQNEDAWQILEPLLSRP